MIESLMINDFIDVRAALKATIVLAGVPSTLLAAVFRDPIRALSAELLGR